MPVHHLHFRATDYTGRILRNQGLSPEQERLLSRFAAENGLRRVLVWGPGKAGRFARPCLGDRFLAYAGRDTPDLERFASCDAVVVGAGPGHYDAIVAQLRQLFPQSRAAVVLLFDKPVASGTATNQPHDFGREDFVRFARLWISLPAIWIAGYFAARRFGLEGAAAFLTGPAAWAGLALFSLEITARIITAFLPPARRLALERLAAWTYPGRRAVEGHPFFQHIGNPSHSLAGNAALGNLTPFNNLGFSGEDIFAAKPPDTVRIAFLGGSTTLDGYPALVEARLNRELGHAQRFEAVNFGMGGFCSAHSLINFLLNGLDLGPDMIVIHEGWNDIGCRNFPPERFRGDYAHNLKSFSPPAIRGRFLLRHSLAYRIVSHMIDPNPAWQRLGPAVFRFFSPQTEEHNADLRELVPFARNLRLIIDIALLRGITPLLTTQPHTSRLIDDNYRYFASHMDQCNEVVRKLHRDYGHAIQFLDLDLLMSGTMDHAFTDVGHLDERGIAFKADLVAESIKKALKEHSGHLKERHHGQ